MLQCFLVYHRDTALVETPDARLANPSSLRIARAPLNTPKVHETAIHAVNLKKEKQHTVVSFCCVD